jgi:hypothetical protein
MAWELRSARHQFVEAAWCVDRLSMQHYSRLELSHVSSPEDCLKVGVLSVSIWVNERSCMHRLSAWACPFITVKLYQNGYRTVSLGHRCLPCLWSFFIGDLKAAGQQRLAKLIGLAPNIDVNVPIFLACTWSPAPNRTGQLNPREDIPWILKGNFISSKYWEYSKHTWFSVSAVYS